MMLNFKTVLGLGFLAAAASAGSPYDEYSDGFGGGDFSGTMTIASLNTVATANMTPLENAAQSMVAGLQNAGQNTAQNVIIPILQLPPEQALGPNTQNLVFTAFNSFISQFTSFCSIYPTNADPCSAGLPNSGT